MKKILSVLMVVVMAFSICTIAPVMAEEATDFTNKICTIENENGYLSPSGTERGKALCVNDTATEWRFKAFLGGSYAFVGAGDLAADVNSASMDEGVTIIQWTSTGANNQRWLLEEAEGGYYIKSAYSNLYVTETDGAITQEAKNEELNQVWKLTVVGEFEPMVEKMLESDAAKSLSDYRYKRLYDFLMSGGEFNLLTYDQVEKMIIERDYFNLSYEEQVAFVEECFTVEPTSLMYGSMATKLKREIKVEYVGIEEGAWQSWHGIPEEAPRLYNVTITDTETGESHVMQYISPYDNDEEYAATVGEAVACFEMPIVKCLWRFVYTSMNTSSWNGGDGTIWNNTGYRGDVNNMVQMFAHELGHVMDNGRQDNNVWYRAIAQDMVPVTGYGNTNRWEDLAEYSRLYLLARGDDMRVKAIENTYPARAKAYKALLYRVDSEFYSDYKDECEAVENVADAITSSQIATVKFAGKYLTDENGTLVLAEEKAAAKDWQLWEVYSQDDMWGTFRNKATGRYICVENGKLTLGEAGSKIGFKRVEGYNFTNMIDAATGFCINEKLEVCEDASGWNLYYEDRIPYEGIKTLSLHSTGEKLAFVEGEGLMLNEEGNTWKLVPVDKDYYLIMDKETGKVFDISGGSVENGASAILYSVTGGTNQHFKLVNNGNGSYKLQLRHSGLYLTKTADGFCQSDGSLGYVNWVIE
ncbi:MAG: RICIN domain-containing protein [Clostridia bacterium]|nr:RICIN domain-containing protein [Clostridia bacterium]